MKHIICENKDKKIVNRGDCLNCALWDECEDKETFRTPSSIIGITISFSILTILLVYIFLGV